MHVEWGEVGLRECSRLVDTAVIVDVLSFSTTVSVAVDRGAVVYPMRVGNDYAPRVAERVGAHLAGRRGDRFSLSPATAARLEPGESLVLPSPNGGGLALAAARQGLTVLAGCLRNASAVATWLRDRGHRALIIPAGERWRDGTGRFAVEDLLGAGAILDGLDPAAFTPEAHVAAAAFRAARPQLTATLRGCTSGQELVTTGYAGDIAWAAGLDESEAVPVLVDSAFRASA